NGPTWPSLTCECPRPEPTRACALRSRSDHVTMESEWCSCRSTSTLNTRCACSPTVLPDADTCSKTASPISNPSATRSSTSPAARRVVDPEVVQALLETRNMCGPLGELTQRELEILQLMAQG